MTVRYAEVFSLREGKWRLHPQIPTRSTAFGPRWVLSSTWYLYPIWYPRTTFPGQLLEKFAEDLVNRAGHAFFQAGGGWNLKFQYWNSCHLKCSLQLQIVLWFESKTVIKYFAIVFVATLLMSWSNSTCKVMSTSSVGYVTFNSNYIFLAPPMLKLIFVEKIQHDYRTSRLKLLK